MYREVYLPTWMAQFYGKLVGKYTTLKTKEFPQLQPKGHEVKHNSSWHFSYWISSPRKPTSHISFFHFSALFESMEFSGIKKNVSLVGNMTSFQRYVIHPACGQRPEAWTPSLTAGSLTNWWADSKFGSSPIPFKVLRFYSGEAWKKLWEGTWMSRDGS